MKSFIKNSLVIALLITSTFVAKAQMKIGDNPTIINAGSVLELESTTKGLMMPRISLTSTTVWGLAGTAAAGMNVYNTNAGITSSNTSYPASGTGIYYWDGTGWVANKGATSFSTTQAGVSGQQIPDGWPMNSFVGILGRTLTIPRTGNYLLVANVTLTHDGDIINLGQNCYATGGIKISYSDPSLVYSESAIVRGAAVGLTNVPGGFSVPLSGNIVVTEVKYMVAGTWTISVQAIGDIINNVRHMMFNNSYITIASID